MAHAPCASGFLPVALLVAALLVAHASAAAHVFLVHGVSDLRGDTDVDVYLNGSHAVTGFRYREGKGYLPLPAGPVKVEVRLVGGGTSLITTALDLKDGVHYSVVAVGSLSDPRRFPFRLLVTPINVQVTMPDLAKLAIFHAAPGAPAVALYANNQEMVPCLAYPSGAEVPAVTAMSYLLQLRNASNPAQTLLDVGRVDLGGGRVSYFFALADFVGGELLRVYPIQPSSPQ